MIGRVAASLVLVLLAVPLRAEDDLTDRFFDGLRDRQLFSLAEGYCIDRLGDERLEADLRARLVVELSRTFAEHGRFREGAERAELWGEADRVLADHLAKKPAAEERILVEMQRAFLPAVFGEFLLRQYEVFPFDTKLRTTAAGRLDEAFGRLDPLVTSLEAARRGTDDAPVIDSAVAAEWLFNVRLRRAVTRLDRASLMPAGSPDRADLLNETTTELKSLASGDPREESTQRCLVLLARTLRLQGRVEEAVHPLEALLAREDEPVSASVRDEIELERTLILLSLNRPDEAAATLVEYRRERGRLPGELRLAMTRCLLGLWNVLRERRDPSADEALERVRQQVRASELEVGGYWALRSRALVELAEEAAEMGPGLALLVRRADGEFRGGDVDAAIDGYREAAGQAAAASRADLAARFGFTLASMELEAGRHIEAARDFATVAAEFPTDERASRASLLAAYALGRVYDDERTAERRVAYESALRRHRSTFPTGETTDSATLMLARLQERRLQYTDALTTYLEVPVENERGFEAAAGAARMFEAILGRLRQLERPTGEWERFARERLGAYASRFPPVLHPLNIAQARMAMTLSRLLLVSSPVDYKQADQLLERVTATWEAIRDDEESRDRDTWAAIAREAAQLRVVALAGRGRVDAARQLIEAESGSEPRVVLDVLDGLTRVLEHADETLIRDLGRLQLVLAEPLFENRDRLDADVRRRLDFCLADAYFATQQSRLAATVCERLLEEHPRDIETRRKVALRLVECGRENCLRPALTLWRELERRQRPSTPAWFEARYHVVLCTLRLGEVADARKLLGVTKVLHPQLGGPKWRERFAALESELAADAKLP